MPPEGLKPIELMKTAEQDNEAGFEGEDDDVVIQRYLARSEAAKEARLAQYKDGWQKGQKYNDIKLGSYIDIETGDFFVQEEPDGEFINKTEQGSAQAKKIVESLLKFGVHDFTYDVVDKSSVEAKQDYNTDQKINAGFFYIVKREGNKLFVDIEDFEKILKKIEELNTTDDQSLDYDDFDDVDTTIGLRQPATVFNLNSVFGSEHGNESAHGAGFFDSLMGKSQEGDDEDKVRETGFMSLFGVATKTVAGSEISIPVSVQETSPTPAKSVPTEQSFDIFGAFGISTQIKAEQGAHGNSHQQTEAAPSPVATKSEDESTSPDGHHLGETVPLHGDHRGDDSLEGSLQGKVQETVSEHNPFMITNTHQEAPEGEQEADDGTDEDTDELDSKQISSLQGLPATIRSPKENPQKAEPEDAQNLENDKSIQKSPEETPLGQISEIDPVHQTDRHEDQEPEDVADAEIETTKIEHVVTPSIPKQDNTPIKTAETTQGGKPIAAEDANRNINIERTQPVVQKQEQEEAVTAKAAEVSKVTTAKLVRMPVRQRMVKQVTETVKPILHEDQSELDGEQESEEKPAEMKSKPAKTPKADKVIEARGQTPETTPAQNDTIDSVSDLHQKQEKPSTHESHQEPLRTPTAPRQQESIVEEAEEEDDLEQPADAGVIRASESSASSPITQATAKPAKNESKTAPKTTNKEPTWISIERTTTEEQASPEPSTIIYRESPTAEYVKQAAAENSRRAENKTVIMGNPRTTEGARTQEYKDTRTQGYRDGKRRQSNAEQGRRQASTGLNGLRFDLDEFLSTGPTRSNAQAVRQAA